MIRSDVDLTDNLDTNIATTYLDIPSKHEYKFCFDYAAAAWDGVTEYASTDNTYLAVDIWRTDTDIDEKIESIKVYPRSFDTDSGNLKCPDDILPTESAATTCSLNYFRKCFTFDIDLDGNEKQDDFGVKITLSGGFVIQPTDTTGKGLLYGTFDNLELSYSHCESENGHKQEHHARSALIGAAAAVVGLGAIAGGLFAYKSKYTTVSQSSQHQAEIESSMMTSKI